MDKIKVLYILPNCRKTGPTQQIFNIISNLDNNLFDYSLITLYPEPQNEPSMLKKYKEIIKHIFIQTSKIDIMFGNLNKVSNYIDTFKPDIIHTSGVFPDYLIKRLGFNNHVMTSRNFVYDDYPAEYGHILGYLLAKLHLFVIKNTKYVVVCSKSLHNIYLEKLNIDIPFIRNGVDIDRFKKVGLSDKKLLRKELGLPLSNKIIVYGAGFIDRKNHEFLLKAFTDEMRFKNQVLLLLGDGPNYERLKNKYSTFSNVIMPGNKKDVSSFLAASDYYVSTSKSEGMPNGVLEAMASGLPCLLSDIEQHEEVLTASSNTGLLYRQNDYKDFQDKLLELLNLNYEDISVNVYHSAVRNFSAKSMSCNYQKLYKNIIEKRVF